MINHLGGGNQIFIEGDSDIIDEDDEGNYSFDNPRGSNKKRNTVNNKKNKSLDDFDEQEEPVN